MGVGKTKPGECGGQGIKARAAVVRAVVIKELLGEHLGGPPEEAQRELTYLNTAPFTLSSTRVVTAVRALTTMHVDRASGAAAARGGGSLTLKVYYYYVTRVRKRTRKTSVGAGSEFLYIRKH